MTVRRWVAVVIAMTLVGACGSDAEPTASRPPSVQGTWRDLPPAPEAAGGGSAIWTGTEMVVWGGGNGSEPGEAGAAYVLEENAWRELSPSPLGTRFGFSAVWTGKEIVYWGGSRSRGAGRPFADGAAYDSETNFWRMIPPAPIPGVMGHEAVWTGTEMVVWGGQSQCCPIDSTPHEAAAAAYNPTTDSWRRVAEVPPSISGDGGPALTVAHGSNVYVYRGGELALLDVAANAWRALPAPTLPAPKCQSTNGPSVYGAIVADRLLVWTGDCFAATGIAFDLQRNEWRTLGDAGFDVNGPLAASADAVFVAGFRDQKGEQVARLMRYGVAENRWAEITLPPAVQSLFPFVALTGDELIVWGGADADGTPLLTGAAYAL